MPTEDELEGLPSDYTFCPDHDDLYLAFMQLLPPGTAWDNAEHITSDAWGADELPTVSMVIDRGESAGKPEPTYDEEGNEVQVGKLPKSSVIRKFMSGLALGYLPFEDAMCESLDEWICRSADINQDAWKKDYGLPDECDIYAGDPCAKVSAFGPPVPAYLIGLLGVNGYTAEGRWLTGDDMEYPGIYSTFRVVVDPSISPAFQLTTHLAFRLGQGHRLGDPEMSGLACMLERYIPAHCTINLDIAGEFLPADLGSKIKLWWSADSTADGAVTSWTDLIASKPVTAAGAVAPVSGLSNGYRFVTFDGIDDFLRTTSTFNPPGGVQDMQMLLLVDVGNKLDDQEVFVMADVPQMRRIGLRRLTIVPDVDQRQLSVTSSTTDELIDTSTAHPVAGMSVLAGDFEPATTPHTIGARANGAWTVPDRLDVVLTAENAIAITIGASRDVAPLRHFKGGLRHAIVTSGLTPHEYLQLEAWLAWDVGRPDILDGSQPYRNIRP